MSTISREEISRGSGADITTDDKWKFLGACELCLFLILSTSPLGVNPFRGVRLMMG
jgi:hypothetical protein